MKFISTVIMFLVGAMLALIAPLNVYQNIESVFVDLSGIIGFIEFIGYSLMGVSILFWVYKYIDWLIPADIEHEIFDKNNIAAAVFKGLMLLAIAIILAGVITAPV